jgi:hypothetical protein
MPTTFLNKTSKTTLELVMNRAFVVGNYTGVYFPSSKGMLREKWMAFSDMQVYLQYTYHTGFIELAGQIGEKQSPYMGQRPPK